jgi:hypothetical protein
MIRHHSLSPLRLIMCISWVLAVWIYIMYPCWEFHKAFTRHLLQFMPYFHKNFGDILYVVHLFIGNHLLSHIRHFTCTSWVSTDWLYTMYPCWRFHKFFTNHHAPVCHIFHKILVTCFMWFICYPLQGLQMFASSQGHKND